MQGTDLADRSPVSLLPETVFRYGSQNLSEACCQHIAICTLRILYDIAEFQRTIQDRIDILGKARNTAIHDLHSPQILQQLFHRSLRSEA